MPIKTIHFKKILCTFFFYFSKYLKFRKKKGFTCVFLIIKISIFWFKPQIWHIFLRNLHVYKLPRLHSEFCIDKEWKMDNPLRYFCKWTFIKISEVLLSTKFPFILNFYITPGYLTKKNSRLHVLYTTWIQFYCLFVPDLHVIMS